MQQTNNLLFSSSFASHVASMWCHKVHKQGAITKREFDCATQHYARIDPKWGSVDAYSRVPSVSHGHVSLLGNLRSLVYKSFGDPSLKTGPRACIGHKPQRGTGHA